MLVQEILHADVLPTPRSDAVAPPFCPSHAPTAHAGAWAHMPSGLLRPRFKKTDILD